MPPSFIRSVREAYLEIYWKEMFFGYLAPRRAGQWEACSECWLPRTDRGPLLGNGRDDIATWYTDEPMGQDWPPPLQPPALASTVAVPAGPAGDGYRRYGQVNEVGLCLETGGGALYEFEVKREEEYFPAPVLDLVLRCCSTTIEAVEMLTRYNLHWGGCNLVVGDTSGMGALIEKSKYHYAVRMSDRNVLVSTYGGCDDEDMRRLCDSGTPLFKYYERRLQVMKEIVAAAEADVGQRGRIPHLLHLYRPYTVEHRGGDIDVVGHTVAVVVGIEDRKMYHIHITEKKRPRHIE